MKFKIRAEHAQKSRIPVTKRGRNPTKTFNTSDFQEIMNKDDLKVETNKMQNAIYCYFGKQ